MYVDVGHNKSNIYNETQFGVFLSEPNDKIISYVTLI